MQVVPLELWLRPRPGPLLPQLLTALADHAHARADPAEGMTAEPLRWAITRVDPERGLCLEGVLLIGRPPDRGAGE